METAHSTILVLIFIASALISVLYYRYILIALGLIFYAPLLIYIVVLQQLAKLLSWYNYRLLNDGRITIWFKRLTGLTFYIISLSEDLLENYLNFVFGGSSSMAIVVQKPGERIPYVPKSERELPEAEQTVIYFEKQKRGRLAEERDRLVGLSEKGRVDALRSASVSYRITVMQLVGWHNVVDKDGNTVPFDAKNKEAMYELLPVAVQEELEEEFGSGIGRTKDAAEAETEA